MRSITTLSVLVAASAVSAQNEILYYKFEGGAGTKVVNYTPSSSPAPRESPIFSNLPTAPAGSWVAGRFGTALAGGTAVTPYSINRVDTGWNPSSFTGSFSYGLWLRNTNNNPPPSLSYIFGIPTSLQFRVYTGSTTLLTTGNATGTTTTRTTANIYQLATAGWVHVALVVDASALTATYYVNGVAEPTITITGGANFAAGTAFVVGQQLPTLAPSIYDIDDFRFLGRAASAAEVTAWALANPAATSDFGAGCDATMTTTGGIPTIGNLTFGFTATGVSAAPGTLLLGLSRTSLGAVPLPLNLGLLFPSMGGCNLECSAEFTFPLVLGGGGTGGVGFPILPNPTYDGLNLYAQGILIGGPRGLMTTNPVAVAIGN
jgi:hypothetical protein